MSQSSKMHIYRGHLLIAALLPWHAGDSGEIEMMQGVINSLEARDARIGAVSACTISVDADCCFSHAARKGGLQAHMRVTPHGRFFLRENLPVRGTLSKANQTLHHSINP